MALLHKFVVRGSMTWATQWRWIHYYATAAEFTPTGVQMQAWATALWNTIKGGLQAGVHLDGIGYSPFDMSAGEFNPKGWGAEIVYPMALVGQLNDEPLPNQVAFVLLGRTAVKRVIAKKFVSGATEQYQAGGVPNGALLTCLNNMGGFLYASTYDMGGTSLTPGCWGPKHGFVPTVSYSLSPYAGSQIRRKPGRGI